MDKILNKIKPDLKILLSILATLSFLSITTLLFAAEAHGEEAHTPLWKDYMWKIINFGILVLILWKFAKKPLQNFLKQRRELIEKTLNEAKEAKEAAQKALQEVEERLKVKDKEIESIISASKKAGEEERERLIAEGYKLKDKILQQAKTNIEFEVKNAKELIKAEAVELAMELAEKKLKEKLTKEEQERLLEDSLIKIGGRG